MTKIHSQTGRSDSRSRSAAARRGCGKPVAGSRRPRPAPAVQGKLRPQARSDSRRTKRGKVRPKEALNEKLTRLVLRAVAKLGGSHGEQSAATAEVMLAVLTYCYASGLYSSRDIAESIWAQQVGRKFLNHVPLDWIALKQFRRHNRDLIRLCLAAVLAELRPRRSSAAARDGTVRDAARHAASAPASLLDDSDLRESERRLDLAVQWDSMEGD